MRSYSEVTSWQSCNHTICLSARLTCKHSAGLVHAFFFLFHPIKRGNLEADKSQKDAVNKSSAADALLTCPSTPSESLIRAPRTESSSHSATTWASWLSGGEPINSTYIHGKSCWCFCPSRGQSGREPRLGSARLGAGLAGLGPGFEKPSVSPGSGCSLVKCWKAKSLPEILLLWVGTATGALMMI